MFASPRSKSTNKTLFLYLRKIIAKFAAMFVFPTPPLPLVTAIVLTLENPVVIFCLFSASFNSSATLACTNLFLSHQEIFTYNQIHSYYTYYKTLFPPAITPHFHEGK